MLVFDANINACGYVQFTVVEVSVFHR